MICVKGDVLQTPFQIIAHQVNCKGVMGAGLAKQIRKNYPNLYNAYKFYCNGANLGDCFGWYTHDGHYIMNIFAQDDYGRDKVYTNYEAMRTAFFNGIDTFRQAADIYEKDVQLTIAIPYMIGCGLAGGDWDKVQKILSEIEKSRNVVFVAYDICS